MRKFSTRLLSMVLTVLMLVSMTSIMAFAQYEYNEVSTVQDYYQGINYDELVGPEFEENKGVYIVNPAWEFAEGEEPATVTFEFRMQTITEKYNPKRHVTSFAKAITRGSTDGIEIPIVILPAGSYTTGLAPRQSIIVLGAMAGINPNVPDADPTKEWKLNTEGGRYIPKYDPDSKTYEDYTGHETRLWSENESLKDGHLVKIENDSKGLPEFVFDGLLFQGNGSFISEESYTRTTATLGHKVYVQNCIFDNAYCKDHRGNGTAIGGNMRDVKVTYNKYLYLSNLYITNQNNAGFYNGHIYAIYANGINYTNNKCGFFNVASSIPWQGADFRIQNSHFWNRDDLQTYNGSDPIIKEGEQYAGEPVTNGVNLFMPMWDWCGGLSGSDDVPFNYLIKNNSFYNAHPANSCSPVIVGMAGNADFFRMEDNIFIDPNENTKARPALDINYIYVNSLGKVSHAIPPSEEPDHINESDFLLDENRLSVKNNTFIGPAYQTSAIEIGTNTNPDTDVAMTGNLYLENLDAYEGKMGMETVDNAYDQWVWLNKDMTVASCDIYEEDIRITCPDGTPIDSNGDELFISLGEKEYTKEIAMACHADNSTRVYASNESFDKLERVEGADGVYTLDTSARTNYYVLSIVSIDGRTERDFYLKLDRALNSDATLYDIIPEGANVEDIWQEDEMSWDYTLNYYDETFSFTLDHSGVGAVVEGEEGILTEENGVYTSAALNVGEPVSYTVTITDAEGLSEVYTLTVLRNYNNETAILGITADEAGTISRDGLTWNILLDEAPSTELTFEISPDATISLRDGVYGTSVEATGETSFEISDILGSVSPYIATVVAQDGMMVEEWYINISRQRSTECELFEINGATEYNGVYVANTTKKNFAVSAKTSPNATVHVYTDAACTDEIENRNLLLEEEFNVVWVQVHAENDAYRSEPVKLAINTYNPNEVKDAPVDVPYGFDGVIGVTGGLMIGPMVIVPLAPNTNAMNFSVLGTAGYTPRVYSDVYENPVRLDNQFVLNLDSGLTQLKITATNEMDGDYREYIVVIVSERNYTYTDTQTAWAKDYVEAVGSNGLGLMKGDENGAFNGGNNLTRYEMAVLMMRQVGINKDFYAGVSHPFSDTIVDWAANYVKAASRTEMINGYTDLDDKGEVISRTYGGDRLATRSEFFRLFITAELGVDVDEFYAEFGSEINAAVAEKGLKDLDQVAEWAKSAVYTAIALGLVSGDQDGNINPNANITRNEVAVLIVRSNSDIIV
ncbi:MAG: S-layer homology domain-containing protein [Clostridia bacterium]|nr:S-layer homology domain-containing protein [Clostridia bacterium]